MNEQSVGDSDKKEKILDALYKAFDSVNESLPEDKKIEKSPETVLFGTEGAIDSLGFTMLIVAIEQKIEEAFGSVITLVDATTMSEEHSPFQSVNKLVVHINGLLEEK